MRNLTISTISAVALAAATSGALADGYGSMKDDEPYDKPVSWSGLYLGGHIGGVWGDVDFDHVEVYNCKGGENSCVDEFVEAFSTDDSAFAGGAQIGLQRQFGNVVAGVEATYTVLELDDGDLNGVSDIYRGKDRNRVAKIEDLFTIGGRLGFAHGRLVSFVKAGYAVADIKFENYQTASGNLLASSKNSEDGYFIGAAIEYAIRDNVSVGLDYTFVDLDVGDQLQTSEGTCEPRLSSFGESFCSATNTNVDTEMQTIMLRLNIRFDRERHHATMK